MGQENGITPCLTVRVPFYVIRIGPARSHVRGHFSAPPFSCPFRVAEFYPLVVSSDEFSLVDSQQLDASIVFRVVFVFSEHPDEVTVFANVSSGHHRSHIDV